VIYRIFSLNVASQSVARRYAYGASSLERFILADLNESSRAMTTRSTSMNSSSRSATSNITCGAR
jgi:hypothetical protein